MLLQISQAVAQTQASVSNPTILAAIIAAFVLLLVNAGAQIIQLRNNNHTRDYNLSVLADKRVEAARKEILLKLNEFFGPFQQLLKRSQELQKLFRADKPNDFRALTYFLNPNQVYNNEVVVLSDNDRLLFDEIVNIGLAMEELIKTKAGLVDDPILRNDFGDLIDKSKITDVTGLTDTGLLPLFVTHLFVMRMAYQGKLKGEVEKYGRYVFPKELPLAIERNIIELNNRLAQLND